MCAVWGTAGSRKGLSEVESQGDTRGLPRLIHSSREGRPSGGRIELLLGSPRPTWSALPGALIISPEDLLCLACLWPGTEDRVTFGYLPSSAPPNGEHLKPRE